MFLKCVIKHKNINIKFKQIFMFVQHPNNNDSASTNDMSLDWDNVCLAKGKAV